MPFPNSGAVNTSTRGGITSYLFAKMATQQTTNVSANDHLKLDTVAASRGGEIALDTTTAYVTTAGAASIGRFTLKGGLTYKAVCNIPYLLGSGATGLLDVAFYDATNSAELTGGHSPMLVATTTTHDIGGGLATAIFTTPGSSGDVILVEVRFITATAVTQIGITTTRTPTVYIETL